ncbi:MAG: acyl carrier protein [Candidatus Entotheonellia bacterium]
MEQEIRSAVKTYILKEFLRGEDPDELKDDTQLITGGILDSLATLKLVTFLEDRYGITFQAHEADVEHMNTIAHISSLVHSKLSPGPR